VTVKVTEILNKVMGAGLLVASMSFFSMIDRAPEVILPGLLFGVSGLYLAARRDRRVAAELELQQRVAQLAESLSATQLELSATQERLDRLTDERDFMRQLAPPSAPARPSAGAQ